MCIKIVFEFQSVIGLYFVFKIHCTYKGKLLLVNVFCLQAVFDTLNICLWECFEMSKNL